MAYIDDLTAARDRYAAQLAAQVSPPDYRWNEYEQFLVEQIDRLDKLIAAAAAAENDAVHREDSEYISRGLT